MFRKVAIKSPAGGGKDYLFEQLNQVGPWCRLAFADPMKQMAAEMTGFSVSFIEAVKGGEVSDDIRAMLPPSIRELPAPVLKDKMRTVLQKLGTEIGRDTWAQDNWVWNALLKTRNIEAASGSFYEGIVITDLRFRNEFDALEKEGFLLVNLVAPEEFHRIKRGTPAYDHPSERDLDAYIAAEKFHLTLVNDRVTPAKDLVRAIYDACDELYHNTEELKR